MSGATPSSIQTDNGFLEESKTTPLDDLMDNTSSNGGTPSQSNEPYESAFYSSNDGNGYPGHIQGTSDVDTNDALSMSFRSMDLASERRGSIEVKFIHEDAERLNKKRR